MLKALRKSTPAARRALPRSNLSFDAERGNALFEALVCEFHWTVLQVGAITSCLNASVAYNRAWMLRSCTNFMPVESSVVRVAIRTWQDIGLPADLASSLRKVFMDLFEAKRLTLPIIRGAGAFAGPGVSMAKLQQLAAVWRKLLQDCEAAVQELEPEARWRLAGLYTANSLVLGKFVKEAIAGSHACVNQVGEVAIPVLPQRRMAPRYALAQPCLLRTQSGHAAASARDISRNGIGVVCEQTFQLKDRVVVELRNARRMRGTIVWLRSDYINIQFDEPLADDDPIFSGGEMRARTVR